MKLTPLQEKALLARAKGQNGQSAQSSVQKPGMGHGSAQTGMSAQKPARAPRHIPGQMNKTEQAFAELLALWTREGKVTGSAYESIRLKVNETCWYTPDFLVQLASGQAMLVEVKAWRYTKADDPTPYLIIPEDSRVKMHAVCALYPFPILLMLGRPVKGGGYEWIADWVAGYSVEGEKELLAGLRRKGEKDTTGTVAPRPSVPESGAPDS